MDLSFEELPNALKALSHQRKPPFAQMQKMRLIPEIAISSFFQKIKGGQAAHISV